MGVHTLTGRALITLMLCASASSVDAQELRFGPLAERVTERLQVAAGERVLLVGAPGRFNSLITALASEITESGGQYLGAISVDGIAPADWHTAFTRQTDDMTRRQMVTHFQDVDVAIMLPGASVEHTPYLAMQDVLRSGRSRTVHFHWSGVYDLHGNLLPNNSITDRLYERAVIDTDYAAVAAVQERFEEALRRNVVRVTTRAGTDLSFRVGERPVTRQDGDASATRASRARNLIDREIELPAGVIRVAPIEESVRGTIVFPDAVWNGVTIRALTMHFLNGRMIEMSAEEGLEAVEAEFASAGDGAKSFREFALGFNPLIPVQARGLDAWIPYYGYGAGVVRLSLGDNSELGGNVTGGYVRWNFFPDATVIVGSEVWVREGRLQ